jgi:hypothetical protein
MGRTIPTATQMLHQEIEVWQPFRKMLPKSERKYFDHMLMSAHKYNYAMMMSIPQHPIAFQPIMMSILFEHYRQLDELKEKVGKKLQMDLTAFSQETEL